MRALRVGILSLALAAAAASGCGPAWTVVRQASPNPLAGKKSFSVADVTWDGVTIGDKTSEADWIAKRKPEEQGAFRDEWDKDKLESGQLFVARLSERLTKLGDTLAPAPSGDAYGIRAQVNRYEPGFFSAVGFGTQDTVLVMTVEISDGAGTALDTIRFTAAVTPTAFTVASGPRLRQAAEDLANQAASYLTARTATK